MKCSTGDRVFQRCSPHVVCATILRLTLVWIGVCVGIFAPALTARQILSARSASANKTSATPPAIVMGFVGGFVAHDNLVHSEVQLAARLRQQYPRGVDVETFESYRGQRARRKILKLLDTNSDGTLTMEEKKNARIIIYGHSWGGSESVYLARALGKDAIPVLLTLQVDSVSLPGKNDSIIPVNVAQAANFYQTHGLVHGTRDIRAADATRTRIIGNFRFDYENSSLTCAKYPWYDRIFVKSHTQIECDPVVWDQVESLIKSELLPIKPSGSAR